MCYINRSLRKTLAMSIAAIAAVTIAAGCGDDDTSSSAGTKTAASKQPATPQTITPPQENADLTKVLGDAGAELTTAGCTFGTFPTEDAEHVEQDADLKSRTFPPTSGSHYEDWAPFGLYDKPVDDGFVLHNLEHGGVVVWFGTKVDEETTAAIAKELDDGEKWLLAPREDIDGLYSAAWAKGLSCPPTALAKLGAADTATGLAAWYDAVASTGSEAEKDVPAYAGAMKEPTPERDISEESPF